MSTLVLDKKADLAGPGIGHYSMLEQILPSGGLTLGRAAGAFLSLLGGPGKPPNPQAAWLNAAGTDSREEIPNHTLSGMVCDRRLACTLDATSTTSPDHVASRIPAVRYSWAAGFMECDIPWLILFLVFGPGKYLRKY